MLRNLKFSLWKFRLPIVAGILIGTSYIPFPPWASWFALVPLWIFWWQQDSIKTAAVGGWMAQFVLTLIGFNWVAHTIHEFGHLPMPIAIAGLLIFCSFANLFLPLTGFIWMWIRQKLKPPTWVQLLLLPTLTSLLFQFVPTIFPWNFGYPWLWSGLPGFHVADAIGFWGLSAVTIFINVIFFCAWLCWPNKKQALVATGAACVLFLFINFFGEFKRRQLPMPDRSARVLIVQANIGNLEKQYAERGWGFRDFIVDQYLGLTEQGIQSAQNNVDIVVWPETAFPDDLSAGLYASSYSIKLKKFVDRYQVPMVVGGYGENKVTDQITNSFYLIHSDGRIDPHFYSKTHLLAFGEYFPMADTFPILRKWIPAVGNFARGTGPSLLTLNDFRIGPQICYESLFAEFSKELANKGAQFFVNLTNDSWYGTLQEPYQHLYMTLARAVEFRRPLIRATNTGISTVALASGEVLKTSPLHKPWQDLYVVPYLSQPEATFYQSFFWLIPGGLCGLLIILIGVAMAGRPKERNT